MNKKHQREFDGRRRKSATILETDVLNGGGGRNRVCNTEVHISKKETSGKDLDSVPPKVARMARKVHVTGQKRGGSQVPYCAASRGNPGTRFVVTGRAKWKRNAKSLRRNRGSISLTLTVGKLKEANALGKRCLSECRWKKKRRL